jgi:glycosyltransferase involved in cell wall biosynthesis
VIIMVYSAFTAKSVEAALGAPEYSYWFVRRAFAPVLEELGIVVPVTDPAREVDSIYRSAGARGQACIFVSFEPPHKTELGLACRTVPVFAWEFDTIPDDCWDDEPRNDWRLVLRAAGSAITHSSHAATAVRRAMGEDYPIAVIPAPVYDAHARFAGSATPYHPPTDITISGLAIDARHADLDVFSMQRGFSDGIAALRALGRYLDEPDRPRQRLRLSGVIYTTIFNPIDGRKNFSDLLGAFVWAFRETEDATLILKITHFDPVRGLLPVLADIAKHGTFRCRVLVIHGMLPADEYAALVGLTSYAVNASTNEGQCLPLMEFMAAGRPAIAPDHTAMQDYIAPDNAFVVPSTARPYGWPHDPRPAMRTCRHIVSFADMVRAYRESYAVATSDPARYAAMSREASEAQRRFCSRAVIAPRLAAALGIEPPPAMAQKPAADPAFA